MLLSSFKSFCIFDAKLLSGCEKSSVGDSSGLLVYRYIYLHIYTLLMSLVKRTDNGSNHEDESSYEANRNNHNLRLGETTLLLAQDPKRGWGTWGGQDEERRTSQDTH